jgi:hypothetical protein
LPLRLAPVIPIHCHSFLTISGNLIEPIDKFSVAASTIDEAIEPIATGAATFGAGHAQQVEFAGEVVNMMGAVAGHDRIIAQRGNPRQ